MDVLNIDQFRLVKNFSRSHSTSRGSHIFERNNIKTNEVNYLRGLAKEKTFKMSAVELTDIGSTLACI